MESSEHGMLMETVHDISQIPNAEVSEGRAKTNQLQKQRKLRYQETFEREKVLRIMKVRNKLTKSKMGCN